MKKKLGDIFEIGSGGTPSKTHSEYYGGNIPWIKTGDLKAKYIDNADEYITEAGIKNSSAKMYDVDTVLIAMYGATIGETSILRISACTNQACAAFKPSKEVLPEYLYYFLQSKKRQFVKDGVGGAQPNISAGYLKKVRMDILPLQEQQYVVDVLNKANSIIDTRLKELQKLDDLIKARFVEKFGEPVSNKKGWRTESMTDVAPAVNSTNKVKGNVWLLNLDMVEAQTGRIIEYLNVPTSEIGNSTCAFDTSNVLYSKLRPYLNKVVIPDRCGYATSELVPLQPVRSIMNREYFAFMLRSDEFVKLISDKVAGAKMPRVSMGDFRKFPVPIPPIELQNQFAAFVAQVDKSKAAVQQALDKAKLLFDSLMQQYFG